MQPQIIVPKIENQIVIRVDPPELKTQLGGASKYYLYRIHGQDKYSEISVYRRYSDFLILKTHMMTRWPGVYIPPLPQKKYLGNNDTEFVDYRRHGLQQFLRLVSEVNYLWYADEFQLFVKNNVSDVEKSLTNMGKSTFREISIKYETVFASKYQNKEDLLIGGKIVEFKAYLKNAQILLQKMAKVSDSMVESRKKFQEKYRNLLEVFLPDYEDKCIKNYLASQEEISDSLYFSKDSTKNLSEESNKLCSTFSCHGKQLPGQSLKDQISHNSLSIINQLIKEQIREFINFNQILTIKQQYDMLKHKAISKVKDFQLEESKIVAGKQSIVSRIKNQNKQQLLKNNKIALEKARKDQEEVEKVCELIEIVLVGEQIERFKEKRIDHYYKVVKMMMTAEKNMSEAEGEMWNKIAGFENGVSGGAGKQFNFEPIQEVDLSRKIQTQIKLDNFLANKKYEQDQQHLQQPKEQEKQIEQSQDRRQTVNQIQKEEQNSQNKKKEQQSSNQRLQQHKQELQVQQKQQQQELEQQQVKPQQKQHQNNQLPQNNE